MTTIIESLLARCASDGDRDFLSFDGQTWTLTDLLGQVRRTAAQLHTAGIGGGDRVAVMLDNHPQHVALGYAIAWLGAVHVPVSVHLRRAGLALQLEDVQPALIIAERSFAEELCAAVADLDLTICWRDGEALAVGDHPTTAQVLPDDGPVPAPFSASPDREALISYTSGTTGRPKGAVLNERYLELGAASAARLSDAGRNDVMFLWEPFYHLAGWATIHLAIDVGARVAMVPRFSASRCWDQIRATGATKLHYLGGVINLLLAQPERQDDADNPVTIAWGAAAPTDRWREFEQRFNVRLREGYGLSEAGNFVTLNLDGPIGSIGRPLEEFDIWVEGEGPSDRAEVGQRGEIIVRPRQPGITMVRYFGDERRTAEVLTDGIVRTGDLGYLDGDGYLYFAGRSKDAIRRRGENVSAWEVERIINEHPEVADSALIAVPSDLGEDDIKVVVRRRPDCRVDVDNLFQWCIERLAYYQVPRYIDIVDELPYGPTHRVRKDQLSRSVEDLVDLEPRLRRHRAAQSSEQPFDPRF